MAVDPNVFSDAFLGGMTGAGIGFILGLGIAILMLLILVFLGIYIIKSIALMKIAKKLKVHNYWLAWIPIGDFYLITQTAKQSGHWTWIFIGLLIPFISNIVGLAILGLAIWFLWITGERLKMSGAWSLLGLIPGIGLVIAIAIYAWGKK